MSPTRFDSENTPEPDGSLSPQRKNSIEKLKQASRVKTSNIFALETKDAYDPTSLPIVERPSANRPLSQQFVTNSFTRMDSMRKENNPFRSPSHRRTESHTEIPLLSPSKSAATVALPPSPEKQASPAPASPTKSSLRSSQFGISSFFDPENGTWSDEDRVSTPRAMHRHQKSVTFHEEPPVINEYEQQTPEPSVSIASDREGSWDSDDFYDEDYSFERGSSADPQREDSFDADLENADKTPVVLPEHWSRMSPEQARMDLADHEDDVFDNSPTQRAVLSTDRIASDSSDSRPLPPLPGFVAKERRDSNSLADAAEWAAHSPRSLPSPPKRASCSKEDILKMTANSSLTMQARLELMGSPNEERPTSKCSQDTAQEEVKITNLDTGESVEVTVAETEVEDSVLADFAAPRISRESILRKVRGTKYDFEDDEDDAVDDSEWQVNEAGRPSIAELARMDPDQAIPSRENSREMSEAYDYASRAHEVGEDDTVLIKPEPSDDDEVVDLDSIPAATFEPPRSPTRMDDYDDRQGSVLHHEVPRYSSADEEESGSRYSSIEPDAEGTMIHTREDTAEVDDGKETLNEAMQLLTVKDYSTPTHAQANAKSATQGGFLGLPTYASMSEDDYDFGMKDWITPPGSADAGVTRSVDAKKFEQPAVEKKLDLSANMPSLQPPSALVTPPLQTDHAEFAAPAVSPPDSPSSVIHNQSANLDDDIPVSPLEENGFGFPAQEEKRNSDPGIPDRIASIKTGGKLKTRPSATRADLEAMMAQEELETEPVPDLPAQFQTTEPERPTSSASASSQSKLADVEERERRKQRERRKSRKSGGRMDLDLGLDTSSFSLVGDTTEGDLSMGLEKEFERVIEGSKVGVYSSSFGHGRLVGANGAVRTQKGYLMRQNTKLVVATNRSVSGESDGTTKSGSTVQAGAAKENDAPPMSPTSDAASRPASAKGSKSPRKPSAEQFLKTEPWNGKMRRKSLRAASALKDPYARETTAPPLPGHESVLGVVDEDYAAGSANLDDDVGEGVERGRLFVKVAGVKNLDLPMPRNERVDFQLTLDNGLHCVTTTKLELGRSAPIGQEFELVVLNDLEFQLTLTTSLPPPPAKEAPIPSSPTKSNKNAKQTSTFSRLLSSPKKRAEKERLEREAAEAEQRRAHEEAVRKRLSRTPTSWDLLHTLVDPATGSFARAYVNLHNHEQSCFGRPLTVDIPCYNEWAAEQDPQVVNSVRSKRGAGPVRRPPYVVGLLELQLLYVPKPKGATDEDMPKSMSSAIREMGRAREVKEVLFEGFLSQQGGDCQVSIQTQHHITPPQALTSSTALASPLLPPRWTQIDRLPRAHQPKTRRHQSKQSLPSRRRQDHPARKPFSREKILPPQIRLCRGRRRIRLRGGRFPRTFRQWRDNRLLRRLHREEGRVDGGAEPSYRQAGSRREEDGLDGFGSREGAGGCCYHWGFREGC